MLMRSSSVLLATSAFLLAPATLLAAPAWGQEPGCEATTPKPKKKLGLGGLLGKARGSGLLGSVMGAARGDGNLKSDLAGVALSAATQAAESAGTCADPAQADVVEQPRVMRQGGVVGSSRAAPARAASYTYPSDLPDPAGFAAVKEAYMEFGKDDCMSCEGGFAYDGWPVHPRDEYSSKYNGKEERMGSWPVGHVHRWKGNVSTGTLTVVSEETIEGFRCRRLTYRLTKGRAFAERPGLLCWGRANQFAGKESWNEVY
jgi:hypothetical protein